MAISLKSIQQSVNEPPRVMVYGTGKIGKSTLAAQADNPIFIQTEDGLTGVKANAFPLAKSYKEVMEAMLALYNEEHDYKTLVIDSIDWLEPLIWQELVLRRPQTDKGHQVQSIEDYGFGKGYSYAVDIWSEFINGLNMLRIEKGMTIILLAHYKIKRQDPPDSEPYDKYIIKLNEHAAKKLEEWVDMTGFMNYKVTTTSTETGFGNKHTRAIGDDTRYLFVQENPAYVAGNRFHISDPIYLPKGESWKAVQEAIDANRPS